MVVEIVLVVIELVLVVDGMILVLWHPSACSMEVQ